MAAARCRRSSSGHGNDGRAGGRAWSTRRAHQLCRPLLSAALRGRHVHTVRRDHGGEPARLLEQRPSAPPAHEGTAPRLHRQHVVHRRAHRRVRLHRLLRLEVRPRRIFRSLAQRVQAARYHCLGIVSAGHRHAGVRHREPHQAGGDARNLGVGKGLVAGRHRRCARSRHGTAQVSHNPRSRRPPGCRGKTFHPGAGLLGDGSLDCEGGAAARRLAMIGSTGLRRSALTTAAAHPADVPSTERLAVDHTADDIGAQLRAASNRLLIRRLRIGLLIVLASVPAFVALDLRFERSVFAPLFAVKLCTMLFSGAAYVLLKRPRVAAHAAVLAWIGVVVICVAAAVSGITAGESMAAVIFCLSVTLVSAMGLPWSTGAQLSAAVVAAAAVGANLFWLHGDAPTSDAIMGVAAALVMLALSVALNYELRQHRFRSKRETLERQRAERQVTLLNESLERRVHERTAQLETARQRLETEMADRRLADKALRESQAQLQDIIDKSPAVIYLKDIHGHYQLVNARWEELFHSTRTAVAGKTDYEIFPTDTAHAFTANDRRVLDANRPLQFEEIAPHDDGPHNYVSVKFPLYDAAGATSGICGISTDISPQKQMEGELRRSRATLVALVESSGDAIWSIDRDYR